MSQRDEIVRASMEPFTRLGFARVTMADIAQAAGLTRSALYHYFPNKEAVFQALSASLSDQVEAAVNQAVSDAGRDPAARIQAAVLARSGWAFDMLRSPHGRELIDEKHRRAGPRSAEGAQLFKALLSRNLARGESEGRFHLAARGLSPDAAADLLLAALDGVLTAAESGRAAQEGIKTLAEFFLAGLMQRPDAGGEK